MIPSAEAGCRQKASGSSATAQPLGPVPARPCPPCLRSWKANPWSAGSRRVRTRRGCCCHPLRPQRPQTALPAARSLPAASTSPASQTGRRQAVKERGQGAGDRTGERRREPGGGWVWKERKAQLRLLYCPPAAHNSPEGKEETAAPSSAFSEPSPARGRPPIPGPRASDLPKDHLPRATTLMSAYNQSRAQA